MKKRTVILLCIAAAVVIAAGIYLIPHLISRPAEKVIGADFSMVDKIELLCGSNGKTATVTDKAVISRMLGTLKNVKLRKSFDQRNYDGFSYSVGFYKNNKLLASFGTISTTFITNGGIRYRSRGFDNDKFRKICGGLKWEKGDYGHIG